MTFVADPVTALSNADISEADRSRVFHSWSAQGSLARDADRLGSGSVVWDAEGNEYLDFSSQLVNVNIGHQHPKVVQAIREQAELLTTVAPAHANATRARAAEMIIELAPEGFEKVFFNNGGADANENAIRMARLVTGRDKVISRYRSYHGNTGAAIVATGDWRRIPNEYARGHVHVFGPYLYRRSSGRRPSRRSAPARCTTSSASSRPRAPRRSRRSCSRPCPARRRHDAAEGLPRRRPRDLRPLRHRHDPRRGHGRLRPHGGVVRVHAHDVTPDLITFAKGVNSGYVPVGGVIISDAIAHHFDDTVFPGGLTYSVTRSPRPASSPPSAPCARRASSTTPSASAPRSSARVSPSSPSATRSSGRCAAAACSGRSSSSPNRESRTPVTPATMGAIKAALLSRGLLPFIADNRIHVVPPCVVTDAEAHRGLDIIDAVLADVARG